MIQQQLPEPKPLHMCFPPFESSKTYYVGGLKCVNGQIEIKVIKTREIRRKHKKTKEITTYFKIAEYDRVDWQ